MLRRDWFQINRNLEFLIFTVLVSIYFIWFAWPLVWIASENSRLVSAFNADEVRHLQILNEMINQRTLKVNSGFTTYGHLFFNVAFIILFPLSCFVEVSEQQIIVVLRLVSVIFAVATVTVTFLLTRRYFGQFAAWLAAFLLSIIPLSFLHYSVMSHPDTVQLFFLVLGIYFCCRLLEEDRMKWVIAASSAAGLAFACKYTGLFLLPIIWMICIVKTIIVSDKNLIKINMIQFARFARFARYVTAAIGIACVILGIIVTPELAARFIAADGSIDSSSYGYSGVKFLTLMRITTVISGCCLTLLSITKFVWSAIGRSLKLSYSIKKVVFSLIAFGVIFFLASPYSFVRLNFIKNFYFQSKHMSFGHVVKVNSSGLEWISILSSSKLLGEFILSLVAISLVLTIYNVSRNGWRQLLEPQYAIWAWVILYMGVLIFRVNTRSPQHLLPVLPFLIILSTLPVNRAINYAKRKLSRKHVIVLQIAILFIIGGIEISKSGISEYRKSTISHEQCAISVKVGQWLSNHYSASTRILYDQYSYIPPFFPDAYVTMGGTIQMLETLKPYIVIVNEAISERFSDINLARVHVSGESEFKRRYEYYVALKNGKSGYILVRDFDEIQVYRCQ
ncbi:MAG: phospholipid carrier-dependent glycosyltransferase [Candidatus Scalindua sp.]|nr:phospholipid carrier-dependent glycosyltransferase [Candidatus Scalindua sp.]